MYRKVAVVLLSLMNLLTTVLTGFILQYMFNNTAIADPAYDQNRFVLYGIVVGLVVVELMKWIAFYLLVFKKIITWRYFYVALGPLIIVGLADWSYSIFWALGLSYLVVPFLFTPSDDGH